MIGHKLHHLRALGELTAHTHTCTVRDSITHSNVPKVYSCVGASLPSLLNEQGLRKQLPVSVHHSRMIPHSELVVTHASQNVAAIVPTHTAHHSTYTYTPQPPKRTINTTYKYAYSKTFCIIIIASYYSYNLKLRLF